MPAVYTKRINFPEGVPLTQWESGTIRVGGTRVTFETVIARYHAGDTPEHIQDGFPSLTLEQINATIDWYLNHRAEADQYLKDGEREEEKIRKRIESTPEYQARRRELHRRIAELRKTGQLTRT